MVDDDSGWSRYWRYLTGRFRGEVDDELAFHVEMRTAELIREGMTPAAARREAERRFGDRRATARRLEQVERKRGGRMTMGFMVEELWQDVRYAVRGLLKRPGFTALTASSLAVGIAVVTVGLAIVDTWLLRPLPVPQAAELVVMGTSGKNTGRLVYGGISLPTLRDLRARTDLFRTVAGVTNLFGAVRFSPADPGEFRLFLQVTGNYFSSLGVRPALGRLFDASDDERRERVVVLTHRAWHTRFGGDPGVIGKTVSFNRVSLTIIGVTAPGFAGTEQILSPDGFVPALTAMAALQPISGSDMASRVGYYQLVARPAPGRQVEFLQRALDLMSVRLVEQYPELGEGYRMVVMRELRARPSLTTGAMAGTGVVVYIGLAGLVLVAACVNAANLILARNTTRQSELTVRRALGASSLRVARQLLVENIVLATVGFGAAWFLARFVIAWFRHLPMPADLPAAIQIDFDARTFVLAGALTLVTGLVAGLGPAIIGSRGDLQRGLKEGGRGGLGAGRGRGRAVLVVAQVASATVVLIAAGLLRSSTRATGHIDLGFDPEHVLTLGVDGSSAGYDSTAARPVFDRIERAVRALPGVQAVSWTGQTPLNPLANSGFEEVYPDNADAITTKKGSVSGLSSSVTPEYFDVLRIPVVAGRTFTVRDDTTSGRVAVVNQRAAELFWPNQSAIGRMIRIRPDGPAIEIVGVVKTGRYIFIGEAPQPYIYFPMAQRPLVRAVLAIRTTGAPEAMVPSVRGVLRAIDQDLVPHGVGTLRDAVNGLNGLLIFRIGSTIATAVGLLAVLLTTIGLYGIIAFGVTQRTQEIGIRMALGEARGRVVRSILAQGAKLAGTGIGIGVGLALLVTQLLSSLLIGVSATDLTVFGTVVLGLAAIAIGSAYIPARRASRLDPVRALRADG